MSRPLAILAAALFLPAGLIAQDTVRSKATGLTLGVGIIGASISTDFEGPTVTEEGGGINLEAGWGFSNKLVAYLGINGASIQSDLDFTLTTVDLGVRYMFREADKQARPYVEGAIAARRLSTEAIERGGGNEIVTVDAQSGGLSLGAGVQYFFTPKVALDLGLTFSAGSFSDWEANGVRIPLPDVDATSTALRIGVRFWPIDR